MFSPRTVPKKDDRGPWWTVCLIDDVLVYGKTKEHDQRVAEGSLWFPGPKALWPYVRIILAADALWPLLTRFLRAGSAMVTINCSGFQRKSKWQRINLPLMCNHANVFTRASLHIEIATVISD
jgi:hypothetical protein